MHVPFLDDLCRSKDISGEAVFQYLRATDPERFDDHKYNALWDTYEMHLRAWDWRLREDYGDNWLEGFRSQPLP